MRSLLAVVTLSLTVLVACAEADAPLAGDSFTTTATQSTTTFDFTFDNPVIPGTFLLDSLAIANVGSNEPTLTWNAVSNPLEYPIAVAVILDERLDYDRNLATIANQEAIVWLWRNDQNPGDPGNVRYQDGLAYQSGAPLPNAPAPLVSGSYFAYVWQFNFLLQPAFSSSEVQHVVP